MKAKEVKEKEAKRLEKMELKEVKMVPFDKMGNNSSWRARSRCNNPHL